MIDLRCPLCDQDRYSVVYDENLDGVEDAFHYLTERPCHYRIVRCDSCGFVYSNPIFEEDRIIALYESASVEGALGPAREMAIGKNMRSYLRHLQRSSGQKSGRLLDVGAGLGHLLGEAREMGYATMGVEPSHEAASYANRRLGDDSVVCAHYRRDMFPEGSFDFITLIHVIDHVVAPRALLETMHYHLRPGGYALIATHNIASLLARLTGKNFIAWSVQHVGYFTPATLKSMGRAAGLAPVSLFGSLTTYPLAHYAENGIRNPNLKAWASKIIGALHLSNIPLSFPFGNIELVCRKEANADAVQVASTRTAT